MSGYAAQLKVTNISEVATRNQDLFETEEDIMRIVSKEELDEIKPFNQYVKYNREKGRFCIIDSAPEEAKRAYEEYMKHHKNDDCDDDEEE